jgi:hypothetical protein
MFGGGFVFPQSENSCMWVCLIEEKVDEEGNEGAACCVVVRKWSTW